MTKLVRFFIRLKLLVSTSTANKLIADVMFARADFVRDNPKVINGLVRVFFDPIEALKNEANKDKVAGIMAKAYGQAEAERLMKEGGSAMERSVNEVWENPPDLGTTAAAGGPPPIGVRVQVTRVQPAMSPAYEAMVTKVKPAYQAAQAAVGRSVLRMGPGSGSTYRRTQQFSKWSELDAPSGVALLQKHFGAQFPAMIDELRKMIVNQQEFISVRRADLSRTGTTTATRLVTTASESHPAHRVVCPAPPLSGSYTFPGLPPSNRP